VSTGSFRAGPGSRTGVKRAVLEVRLVPRAAIEGFLNAYIWTIALTPDEVQRLDATAPGRFHRRRRLEAAVREIVADHVRRRGMPTFGKLADYRIDFEHAFLRIPLKPG